MGSGIQDLIDQELLPEKIRLIRKEITVRHSSFQEAFEYAEVSERMAPAILYEFGIIPPDHSDITGGD